MKVYGPYTRKDGRQHVVLVEGKKKTSMSYPKFLMEKHLGRKLEESETVDHKDRDITNNDLSNLQVLTRKAHIEEDVTRVRRVEGVCVWCGNLVKKRRPNQLHRNAQLGKAGPFCSRACSGKYGAAVQHGKIQRFEAQPEMPIEERIYYKNQKDF